MKISGINSFPQIGKINEVNKNNNGKFGNVLSDFVKQVNTEQQNAKQITNDFIEGKDVELHEVMIAGEKAATSLDLLIEIRNKAIDMYKELSRM
jgi:flagellar hook-basal body complex protein FliE